MNTKDIISLISRIRGQVNLLIESEMSKQGIEGIVTSHGDIIFALFNKQRLTMAEIAERIDKDKSTVTALVNKLVRLGYVIKVRDVNDARVFYVSLTEKGDKLKPVFETVSVAVLDIFYSGISENEKEELIKILNKIYNNF